MDTLYIVMPAYNESEGIVDTITQWYPIVERVGGNSRLVVVDDGSKDATLEILRQYARSHPLLMPLTKPNGGHGPALIFGYGYAVKRNADYVFQTDSDGQTSPREFWQMWEKREQYDAQFGNRTVRGDGRDRAFVESTLCKIVHHYFKVDVPDANAPFRLMSRAFLETYLPSIPVDYNLPNVMLVVFGAYRHDRIRFVPITFDVRRTGTNSINVGKIVGIGWRALSDFRRFRAELRSTHI